MFSYHVLTKTPGSSEKLPLQRQIWKTQLLGLPTSSNLAVCVTRTVKPCSDPKPLLGRHGHLRPSWRKHPALATCTENRVGALGPVLIITMMITATITTTTTVMIMIIYDHTRHQRVENRMGKYDTSVLIPATWITHAPHSQPATDSTPRPGTHAEKSAKIKRTPGSNNRWLSTCPKLPGPSQEPTFRPKDRAWPKS